MTASLTHISVQTLSQFSAQQPWQLTLAQSRAHHTLIWVTRGQGRMLLDGMRRGVGAHNALWIPADQLFSLDLGPQATAQVMTVPAGAPLRLPQVSRQLRIREVQDQNELTGILENAAREQNTPRALQQDALEAHAALTSVWLRRQTLQDVHIPDKKDAAGRLSARFCATVAAGFASGAPMAAYAADLGVTPTHLTRTVKACTGKTAADILTERIVFEARVLLLGTSEPAQAIAAHLGFGSAAYFTRFVQKHTGAPPSKLRH